MSQAVSRLKNPLTIYVSGHQPEVEGCLKIEAGLQRLPNSIIPFLSQKEEGYST